MAASFKIQKSANGKFWFNLVAGNGEVILTSQMYAAYASAENGADSVKVNAPDISRYERKSSENGKPYFVLKAANGQVIGNSQMYSSEASRDNGIASVMKAAPEAAIVDKTAE